ncbi:MULTISPECIES: hypothetical protein [Streptomyces violaceusniger group]|uniref:hypothetical protein n=1 Tax=Streptomyces violaceusniger group TaxID=2839105 RepID=UPI001BA5A4B9|nr:MULTISPECIES: hypothetical protein [Streptomyces violaceusniger group]
MPVDQPWLTVVAGGAHDGADLSLGELISRRTDGEPHGRPVVHPPRAAQPGHEGRVR